MVGVFAPRELADPADTPAPPAMAPCSEDNMSCRTEARRL